jgi:hypothetical protein
MPDVANITSSSSEEEEEEDRVIIVVAVTLWELQQPCIFVFKTW